MAENDRARGKRIAVVTNNLECERHVQYYCTLEKYLKANGYEICADFDVELVVVCGCGFHDFMYRKVQNTLRHLRRTGVDDGCVVVMGCLPKTHEGALAREFAGRAIPYGHEEELDALLGAEQPFALIEPPHVHPGEDRDMSSGNQGLFYIKVADGCLRQCTFCIINKAKGELCSEPLETILKQYRKALAHGYRRIFLMAEDTFAYGVDAGSNIMELCEQLLAVDPNVEIHFGSLHSRWLVEYGDGIRALCRRGVVRQLHVGLQHVNDAILTRMGRPAPFAQVHGILTAIKQESPALILSADILVGFPGETEAAFTELEDFARDDTCFSFISHFGFSDSPEAVCFGFDGKVDPLVVASRWDKLRQVLGPRSFYNRGEEHNAGYRAAYQSTFDRDFSFCRDDIGSV